MTQFGAALEFCGTDGANAYILRGLVDGYFNSYLDWLKLVERDVLLFQTMKTAHLNCPCCGEAVVIAIPKIEFHIGLRMASRPFVRCPKCADPLIMFIGKTLTPECIVDWRG
jgi:ribosomal protein S27AE